MRNNTTIHKKSALVTGASRGIGKAAACVLAEDGYDLILTAKKSEKALEECALDLEERFGAAVRPVLCDAGNPEDVRKLFRDISSLDLLVNNAGISYIGLLQDMTDEEWSGLIRTNLSSCFYTCRAAIPLFLARPERAENPDFVPGRIINISSVWGNAGASCEAAYSASKGGINALTRALGKELAPSRIPVNAIACGCVDTQMNGQLDPEERAALEEEIPAGRFADPSEIAETLLLLAKAPSYLTGQVITVDGGWI